MREKLSLTETCIYMNKFKYAFTYNVRVHIEDIMNISYFDQFENVIASKNKRVYPKNVRCIHDLTNLRNIS